ncbi:conserved hypothetical protein [Ricinus communis]|uniref:DUF4283 domain-containing protein n=1 Tax=Ricinus communis TaxID=3988 RepID=B9T189_RICCO|nr:conserved hypothetical protein [Ricinus communis]
MWRFLTEKPIKFSFMKQNLASLCRPVEGVCIREISSTLFLFQFFHEIDMKRVINSGPSTFEQHLLLLKQLEQDEQLMHLRVPTRRNQQEGEKWLRSTSPIKVSDTVVSNSNNMIVDPVLEKQKYPIILGLAINQEKVIRKESTHQAGIIGDRRVVLMNGLNNGIVYTYNEDVVSHENGLDLEMAHNDSATSKDLEKAGSGFQAYPEQ